MATNLSIPQQEALQEIVTQTRRIAHEAEIMRKAAEVPDFTMNSTDVLIVAKAILTSAGAIADALKQLKA